MKNNKSVLVAVLKNRRDLNMLLKKHIYRMPVFYAPKKKAEYIAFYQPSSFGSEGSRINYYAKIKNIKILKRENILPQEKDHPNAKEEYCLARLAGLKRLDLPVLNRIRMRISFGFTSVGKLLKAGDVGALFDIPPMEEMISDALKKKRIGFFAQHGFCLPDRKRYRMDFAVFCKKGPLNIECDGTKWHSIKAQRLKDKKRDRLLKKQGWTVLRLKEKEIVNDTGACVKKVEKAIQKLGGGISKK